MTSLSADYLGKQGIEVRHDLHDGVVHPRQRLYDGFLFPPNKIVKRYLRNELAVAIEFVHEVGVEGNVVERDQLLINRQEKSVTMLSTPTYKNESCKKLLGKPETVTYRLLDGSKLYKERTAAAQKDKSNLYQFSGEATAIISRK